MSFIVKVSAGAVNWSAVTIDADKDMGAFGLSNVKQVAAAMIGGDLVAKGLGGILVRIPAGIANTVLTSAGVGLVPTWAPGGLYLNRYYPVPIRLIDAETIQTADHTNNEPAPLTSPHVQDYLDGSTLLKMLTPAITMPDAEAIQAADHTNDEPAPVHTHFDLSQVLEAAVEDNGGAMTTQTTEAKNATANDMTLMEAVPANNDAYYFGSDYLWDELWLNIGTNGSWTGTTAWEYYDVDTTWHALAVVTDAISNFEGGTGVKKLIFTKDANWTAVAVNGITKYWIRARVTGYTAIVTQPKGTQAWYLKKT